MSVDEPMQFASFLADPMGTVAAARGGCPIVHTESGLGPDPLLVIGHEEVRALFADDRLEVNFVEMLELLGITSGPFYDWMALSPLNNEGDEHRRFRNFMNRTFTPARVRVVQPFLAEEADRLAAALAARGDVELMADFADILPALGLCELIGVPAEDRAQFTKLAQTIGIGFRPLLLVAHLEEVDQAVTELIAYARSLLERRAVDPVDDLVSHMATTRDEAGYSADECAAFLAGLVFAGNDTTRNQIGWMVATLIDHPQLWDDVASGKVAVDVAVEELMRFRSAVPGTMRRANADFEVAGVAIEAGSRMMLSLWGADSDPAMFAQARELDPVANSGQPHLAFGHGPHHCLGAALARVELQEALRALTTTLEVPEVREPIEWDLPVGINGPTRMPLRVQPRR
jgi:cytochrome P450